MLPLPSVATSHSKTAPPPPTTHAPSAVLPVGALCEPDKEQFEFDHNVLLSPPPDAIILDHFDEDASSPPGRGSSDLDPITSRNVAAHALNNHDTVQAGQSSPRSEPIATGLQIETDLPTNLSSTFSASLDSDSYLRHSVSTSSIPKRTPSIRATLHSSAGSLSPGSALSSPQLAAMLNITPLPSPIEASRDLWRISARTRSRNSSLISAEATSESRPCTLSPPSSPPKRKIYNGLHTSTADSLAKLADVPGDGDASERVRNRSISDYVPEAMLFMRPRNVAVSGNVVNQELLPARSTMHREEYLAVQRGFSIPSPALKSPSTAVKTHEPSTDIDVTGDPHSKKARTQFYTAQNVANGRPRKYKLIRHLGQGTFSKVFLAVRQVDNEDDGIDYARDSTNLDGVRIRSRRLVAIKVVEQGPVGGADTERVEISLRREIEVLKAINHPSLVHLKAFGTDNTRSLLVLNYCQGGDLFEVASSQLEVLVPSLVRRIFAELVSAVRYLHQKYIVHRDIKLESE